MARLTAPALALATLAPAAAAQSPLTLLDFLSPDRLVIGFVQTGIMALRTQVDLVYGDMDADVAAGRVTLTDLQMWPLPDWDGAGDCRIDADRVTLRTTPFDTPETLLVKAQVAGVSAPLVCLPPDARAPFEMAGLDTLSVPRMTVDISYDVPSAGALAEVFATVDGAVAATLVADFSYLWVDGRNDMENPDPVVFLDHASLTLENLGLWEALQPVLPPAVSDPASAPMLIEGMLGQALGGMNRDAAGPDAAGDPSALGDGQRAFIASAAEVWPAFLATPGTLVLETTIAEDVFLDLELMESDPRAVFDTLKPAFALKPAGAGGVLPLDLVQRALEPDAALSDEERRAAGLAFATGAGAPPSLERAVALLRRLAEAGDGDAALVLSDALAVRSPRSAYVWALRAGAAGAAGATAQLDRMERDLGFADTLALQREAAEGTSHDIDALATLGQIREKAAMRLSGRGLPRHYGFAAMWAMIGAAAGDAESADILAEIEDRVARAGAEGAAAWVPFEAEASALAMSAWVGQDLPARFGR